MRIIIKYPTRGRPELFTKTLARWRQYLSGSHEVRFLVSIDRDDALMVSKPTLQFLRDQPDLTFYIGNSRTKVQAINADWDKMVDYDMMIMASDDMVPVVHGYDDVLATQMQKSFPGLDGCLHFSDGYNIAGLNTLPILGKNLIDDWGYIYHPAYVSEWCDNEMECVTERDKKSFKSPQCLIKHEWVKATGRDATFKKNSRFFDRDKRVFRARRAAGFPKAWPPR